jgi:hypothetical protein
VGLLDFHVELAQTNHLLKRIADALDRAIPPPVDPQQRRAYEGAKVTVEDLSCMGDPETREREREKIAMDRNIWRRYGFEKGRGQAKPVGDGVVAQPGGVADQGVTAEREAVTRVGTYDHDDPLDTPGWLEEEIGLDRSGRSLDSSNHAGF